ncbi:hypothetical protein B0J12DRAFT_758378 [Macrophomina phaseolina]|uniref:Uncharacterized protein n=1 Tax=Macrophomina phaseolina TaxID=35725 RepID=A0ABQ8GRS3_9PEZI|nr:hypothetical protein B0J12DRAFT_758378 [Macrophomina phaseolina]
MSSPTKRKRLGNDSPRSGPMKEDTPQLEDNIDPRLLMQGDFQPEEEVERDEQREEAHSGALSMGESRILRSLATLQRYVEANLTTLSRRAVTIDYNAHIRNANAEIFRCRRSDHARLLPLLSLHTFEPLHGFPQTFRDVAALTHQQMAAMLDDVDRTVDARNDWDIPAHFRLAIGLPVDYQMV